MLAPMRQRQLALALCVAWLALASNLVHAQGDNTASSGVPAAFERFDVSDVSFTLRDDTFTAITPDPVDPKIAYLGTVDGRIYRTDDRGQTWTESTVLTQPRLLWQTSGSSIFFGQIRSQPLTTSPHDIIGERPSPLGFQQSGYVDPLAVLGPVGVPPTDFPYVSSDLPKLPNIFPPLDGLSYESSVSAGSGSFFYGVGLSARSPRLSILTGSRGRPVPVLNRQRLLIQKASRPTAIISIKVDPDDRKQLFAATLNGLYKSYDGGVSWARTFAGFTPAERVALKVAIRPGTPKLLVLGTASGAYTSTDQGENWAKITTVGGTGINDVAFDPENPDYIYLATQTGVLRSTDGGKNFVQIYYSTFPAENDTQAIVIDPFDVETAYIGTMRGARVTHNLRSSKTVDWTPLEGVESILSVVRFAVCPRHRGHIYALSRLELNTINYGADAPESVLWESWDGGKVWRPLFTGREDGVAQAFAPDAKDPDQVWIVWSHALFRLERVAPGAPIETGIHGIRDDEPPGPTMEQVLFATLRYQGLELDDYKARVDRANSSHMWPRALSITGFYRQWALGGKQDDNQFAPNRYLIDGNSHEWSVMAWASWDLPSLMYDPSSVPLLRYRVNTLNDELRRYESDTARRAYGEIERLRAELAASRLDLKTRVIYRLRIEQLEAIVDLVSGDFLTRWYTHHRRATQ
jgi:hypothetical protein